VWHGRRSLSTAAALVAALFACAPAQAADTSPAALSAALNTAYAVVDAAAARCKFTPEPQVSATAEPVPWYEITPFRPDGYNVVIDGETTIRESFRTLWFVSGGVAYPQSIPAARLAAQCRPGEPKLGSFLDWHRLTYLDPSTGDVEINSNPEWGGRIITALAPYVGSGGRQLEDPSEPMWIRGCTSASQTARFTRVVNLLGPPQEMKAFAYTEQRGFSKWPVTSFQFYVNGARVGTANFPAQSQLEVAIPPQLVRFGPNQLDLLVTKRRTGGCNNRSGRRALGVLFSVTGKHAWSLSVDRPPPATSVGAVILGKTYTLHNAGPSYLLEPAFTYRFKANSVNTDQYIYGETGAGTCTPVTVDIPPTGGCGLGPIPPGGTSQVTVHGLVGPKAKNKPYRIGFGVEWHFNSFTLGEDPGFVCVAPANDTTYCKQTSDDIPRP
jgi:hypothetical protein